MSVFKKYYFLIAAIAFVFSEARGQATGSPFTTFGIGDRFNGALINNQGMAGVGLSNPQSWYLNNQNPALLVYNTLTVFEAGILAESRTLRGDTLNERNQGGNLSYLATAFPLLKKPRGLGNVVWTNALGLMPYTNVSYKLQYSDKVQGINNTTTVREEGSGGFSEVYWSHGVRLTKRFSIGLKSSYIFSSVVNDYSNSLDSSTQRFPFNVGINKRTRVQDFTFLAGISYSRDSLGANYQYRFNFGAVYGFGTNLKATQTDKFIRTNKGDLADTTAVESITLVSTKGNLYVPAEIGFGLSYAKKLKWAVGADFRYQDWSKFKSINQEDEEGLATSWGVSIGGEYTPSDFSTPNLLKRLTYRAGVSYDKCPFTVNNRNVNDVGINFGLSVPTGSSNINVAVRLGKRGNKAENILAENYFRVYFGITINDRWFIPRRFD